MLSQSASGPGTQLPADFGSPDDPQTPYEFFSGTPGFTGTGAQADLDLDLQYEKKALRYSLEVGAESYDGSGPNILYLGEPMMPASNPFMDSRIQRLHSYLGLSDTVGTSRTSVLSASVGARGGSWGMTGGWFLPQHTLGFVFAPPPLPNTPPAVAPQLPESAGASALNLTKWNEQWPSLPLQGIDAWMHEPRYDAEFVDASLPTLFYSPGFSNDARVKTLFVGFPSRHGVQFAVQAARVDQDSLGAYSPIPAGVMWGADEETSVGVEGPQPESDVFGQRSTLVGVSARLPIASNTSLLAEIGRSWFSAQYFSAPGRPTPGGYYHVGATRSWNSSCVSLDLYRFEPTYAPNVLAYGNFLNIWPVAWAWPANWLKNSYQLVENDQASTNRQGFRARYDHSGARFSYGIGYAQFAQVTPYDAATARQPGFTDPFFTSLDDAYLSYRGTQRQISGTLQWRATWLTASLDAVEDFLRRPAPAAFVDEKIDLDVPQYLLTISHSGPRAVYAIGEGRFALDGCFAVCSLTKVQVGQRMYFAGVNLAVAPRSMWLLEWRRYVTDGLPFGDLTVSPAYTGTRIILEERFTLPQS